MGPKETNKNLISTILTRSVLFMTVWWFLADGDVQSWWLGVPAVLIAIIVSIAMLPPMFIAWVHVLRFLPFFLLRSLLGGMDVAWRAFKPDLPIAPDFIEYPIRLPQGLPRVLMANIVNLLPGTLTAEFRQDVLIIHVLDSRQHFLSELEDVERNVARMFDIPLQVLERGT